MFDMLDDDLEIGYVPTMPSNSRSGNMKKLTKKQPKAPPKQPLSKPTNNKSNDFDDLLDDLIELDHKKPNKSLDNKSAAPKNLFNSLESEYDEPKSTSVDKKSKQPVSNNLSKSPVLKLEQSEQIIHQDRNFTSFGKSQQNIINNSSKPQEVFVSSRNMKPPMRKKSQVQTENLNFGMGSIGLTIPEENNLKTISKNEEDDIIKPPPRLMNRRSSADAKNQQSLSLPKNNKIENTQINSFSFEHKKQEQVKPRGLTLSLDEPKLSPKMKKKQEISYLKQQPKPAQLQVLKPQKIKQQKHQKGLDMHVDQSITIFRDSPPQMNSNKSSNQQYQKQIGQMKITFQKQIDFLQENLDRQIAINRQTRDKLMRQSNKMIEDERARSKKIHEEQIKRIKEMFEWEKKRTEQTYQIEIQNLRQSLQYAQKTNNYSFKTTNTSRQDLQYLQSQLKHQKKLIEDRQRILQKRQFDLSQRQIQLNKRRRKEEDRLRQQQKRILQTQTKLKKQLLEQKRFLSEEKQQMAIELANLQIEAMKKRQKAQYSLKQNKIEKEGLQNQRYELRNQNAELMARYRAKVQEVQHQKARIKAIENDLVKKLKIVQQKMRQTNQTSLNKTAHTKKQNNWIQDRDVSHQNLKTHSFQRKQQGVNQSIGHNQTKDRFYQLQSNVKNRVNVSVRQNKKFDLDNYMMTVQQYKKLKGEA